MLDLFNIAKPQGCDIQTFYGDGLTQATAQKSWIKPRGVSHTYILLIGPGASGTGVVGGGSGAVTVWYGAAQNVPDELVITVAGGGTNWPSTVAPRVSGSGANPTAILSANGSGSSNGGTAMTANQFAASGFFQSVAGQNGVSGAQSASTSTFLSGGGDGTGDITANYGYKNPIPAGTGNSGFFQLQPIIVGVGANCTSSGVARGGIGCGGGASSTNGIGGPGMVLIASW